jgi:hypothetical protein
MPRTLNDPEAARTILKRAAVEQLTSWAHERLTGTLAGHHRLL